MTIPKKKTILILYIVVVFIFIARRIRLFFMNTSICRLSFEANAKNVGEKVPKCFLENAEALLLADGHVFDIYKFDKFDI